MSKELEELEELNYNLDLTKTTVYINHYYDIKQALQRLEAIEKGKVIDIIDNYMAFKNDNAKPSEAIKELCDISYFIMEAYSNHEPLKENQRDSKQCFMNYCSNIKQALLKTQEQEKVLKIIFEKRVNLEVLGISNNVNCYNKVITRYSIWYKELTQEEFHLLKRYCNE